MTQVTRSGPATERFTVTRAFETVLALGVLGAGGYGVYTVVKEKNNDGDGTDKTQPAGGTQPGGGNSTVSDTVDGNGLTGVQIGGIAALLVGVIVVIVSFLVRTQHPRLSHLGFLSGLAYAVVGTFFGIFGVKGSTGDDDVVPGIAMFLSVTGVLALAIGKAKATRVVGLAGALLSAASIALLSFTTDDTPTKVSYYSLAAFTGVMNVLFVGPSPSGPKETEAKGSRIWQIGGPVVFWTALVATLVQVWALVMTGVSSPKSKLVYTPLVLTGGVFLLSYSLLYRAAKNRAAKNRVDLGELVEEVDGNLEMDVAEEESVVSSVEQRGRDRSSSDGADDSVLYKNIIRASYGILLVTLTLSLAFSERVPTIVKILVPVVGSTIGLFFAELVALTAAAERRYQARERNERRQRVRELMDQV